MLCINIFHNSDKHTIEIDLSNNITYNDILTQIKNKLNFNPSKGELKLMTTDTFTLFTESFFQNILSQYLQPNSQSPTLNLQASILDSSFISNYLPNPSSISITSSYLEYPSNLKNQTEQENLLLSIHPSSQNPPPSSFPTEYCDICTSPLVNEKYICCICSSLTMCPSCESTHPHSSFKYKQNFLSTLHDTYSYIKQYNFPQEKKSFFNISKKEIDIKLEIQIENEISLPPHQMCKIPFLIINNSKQSINSKDLKLFIRNYKHLTFYYEFHKDLEIHAKNSVGINIYCQSGYVLGKEDVIVEIYCEKYMIKDFNKKACVSICIDVNTDDEDMKMRKLFYSYDKIQVLKKEYKEIILYIMKEGLSDKAPLELYDVLRRNKWNVQAAMNELMD